MKKLLLVALVVFGFNTVNAQEKVKEDIKKGADAVEKEAVKLYNQAKTGGFKIGANIGLPLSSTRDVSSFNFGFDATYLFEVATNLEVGGMLGYTNYTGDGDYRYINENYDKSIAKFEHAGVVVNHKSANFVPIAVAGRYYFNNRKMFAGLDLGYAIKVAGDDEVNGGLYARPKFGFNFGKFSAIGSFQTITGGVKYYDGLNTLKVSGFNSFNVGVEYSF